MDGLWARGERTKHQIPNTKLQRNPKLQIPKPVAGSLPWSLGLGASLEFGTLIGARISPLPEPLPTCPSWGEGIDRGLGRGIKMRPCAFKRLGRGRPSPRVVSQTCRFTGTSRPGPAV